MPGKVTEVHFDRSCHVLYSKAGADDTCANGCKCDYTVCGDQDPYLKEHPEYRDENGYRRNRE